MYVMLNEVKHLIERATYKNEILRLWLKVSCGRST